jgi:hypothetical protein
MTTQERISKLQGLLTRVQRNASRPRGAAAVPDVPRAPVVPTAPFAAHPAPPPVAFASPAPLPAAPPPPIPTAVTASAAYSAPQPSAADQSVDDLLGGPDDAMAVDIDVPLDTIPPVAVTPAHAPESEPIPLVASTSTKEPLPPPIDDAFGLESEVSEVRMAAAPRDSDVEVTVAAIEAEAEAEVIATEELSEADLVELTESSITTADADVDIDFEEEDDQPPASSQRSRVASSMDEALAAAAEHDEAEHDVPLKTPPPESGPQEAAAPAAGVDALLGEELEIPMRAEAARSSVSVPTAEQLGQTIELEEARGPSLELAEPVQSSVPPAAIEELEVALPSRDVVGGYDDSLMPPPEARDDLEAHRRRQDEELAPPPESLAQLPSIQPGGGSPEIVPLPRTSAPVQPQMVARPAPTGSAESFASVRESFQPASFVELLDASLSLGGD